MHQGIHEEMKTSCTFLCMIMKFELYHCCKAPMTLSKQDWTKCLLYEIRSITPGLNRHSRDDERRRCEMVCDNVYVCVWRIWSVSSSVCQGSLGYLHQCLYLLTKPLSTQTHTYTHSAFIPFFSLGEPSIHILGTDTRIYFTQHTVASDCTVNYCTIDPDWLEVQKHGEGIKCFPVYCFAKCC